MRICRLLLACALLTACSKHTPPPGNPPSGAPPPPPEARAPEGNDGDITRGTHQGETADSFFDPKNYPDAVQGEFVDPAKLTATERQYGVAPKRDPRVTYQDGIILMEHGDQAIREAKTDGMTYSFDVKAEHVGEFAEGKIIFATGRVLGRVGQLTRSGDTVTVKLAPVAITEVIQKGTFMMNSSFNPKDLIIYAAPDFPSSADQAPPQQSRNVDPMLPEPRFLHTRFGETPQQLPGQLDSVQNSAQQQINNAQNAVQQGQQQLNNLKQLPSGLGKDLATHFPQPYPVLPASTVTLSKGLDIVPAIGSDGGIGLSFSYNKNGILFNGEGQIVLPAPKIRFLLDIGISGIKTFGIEISGSTSLRMEITARSDLERYVNVNTTNFTPIDISLPCPIAGVPLALSFKTSFNLHTEFGAKTSVLTSSGSWGMSGTLFAGWKNGSLSGSQPDTHPTSSLAGNVSGASLAINRIGGAINIRPMVGLGGFGFTTGVWLGITFTGDIAKQASEAMVDCHVASGTATMDSGVGYQLPGPAVDFVNAILKLFTKYRLDKEGTFKKGFGGPLFNVNEDIPSGCGGFKSGGAAKT